jgi:purine-binding chemotaxis protein CheW
MPRETAPEQEGENKFLTFKLGREDFAIELRRVREIMPLVEVAAVPLAPAYVRGIINLRGQVVPVVDLRRKFGLPSDQDHDRKCIIVCDVRLDSRLLAASLLVDAVCEVRQIAESDIEPPPVLGAGTDVSFLRGVAKLDGHVKFMLDIDAIFGSGVLSLEGITQAASSR